MGCCSSRSRSAPEIPQTLQQRSYRTFVGDCNGLQVGVSAAGLFRHRHLVALADIQHDGDRGLVFVGFFDGDIVPAEYCAKLAFQEFQRSMACSGGEIGLALRQTFKNIDATFLQDTAISPVAQATGEASGCLVVIDTHAVVLHAACLGNVACAVGKLVHGLNAQTTDASHALCCDAPACATLGNGRLKCQRLAEVYNRSVGQAVQPAEASMLAPKCLAEAAYLREELTPAHEHIVVGSRHVWRLISPQAAALRAHLYTKAHTKILDCDASVSCASNLVRYASTKWPDARGSPPLPDYALLSITLRWPTNSVNYAFAACEISPQRSPAKRAPKAIQPRSPDQARTHWRLARTLLVEYPRLYRSIVVRKWRAVVAETLRRAAEEARRLEARLWAEDGLAVQVSPSLACIRAIDGSPLGPAVRARILNAH